MSVEPNKKKSAKEIVTTTNEFDVLLGRGKGVNDRPGNVSFRKLAAEKAYEHLMSENAKQKREIAERLIVELGAKGGRFLRAVDSTNEASGKAVTGVWEVVSAESTLAKVKQAIRDAAFELKNRGMYQNRANQSGTPSLEMAEQQGGNEISEGQASLLSQVSYPLMQSNPGIQQQPQHSSQQLQSLMQQQQLLEQLSQACNNVGAIPPSSNTGQAAPQPVPSMPSTDVANLLLILAPLIEGEQRRLQELARQQQQQQQFAQLHERLVRWQQVHQQVSQQLNQYQQSNQNQQQQLAEQQLRAILDLPLASLSGQTADQTIVSLVQAAMHQTPAQVPSTNTTQQTQTTSSSSPFAPHVSHPNHNPSFSAANVPSTVQSNYDIASSIAQQMVATAVNSPSTFPSVPLTGQRVSPQQTTESTSERSNTCEDSDSSSSYEMESV